MGTNRERPAQGAGSSLPLRVARAGWSHRWLAWSFVTRELSNRYAGSVAGLAWAFVHPLVQLALYSVLFVAVFKVRLPETTEHPFVVFMALGMWPWLAFSEGLSRGTLAVVNNAALVKKVAFPHFLLVYGAVTASFVVHLAGFAAVLLVLVAMGVKLHVELWPVLLWALLVLYLLAMGLALVFSAVQLFVRDFEQLLSQLLNLGFYLTPIIYPVSALPQWLQAGIAANPLTHVVEPLRAALLQGDWPDPWPMAGVSLLALLTLLLGHGFFARLSPHFEDVA